jgi:hypothetical protein
VLSQYLGKWLVMAVVKQAVIFDFLAHGAPRSHGHGHNGFLKRLVAQNEICMTGKRLFNDGSMAGAI